MPISSDLIRGHTDTIILAHLIHGDSYGYRINRDILEKSNKKYELKEATLYTAFRRLEKEELITSYWGNEDLGARRRYYSITQKGRNVYGNLVHEWNEAKALIDSLITSKEVAQ